MKVVYYGNYLTYFEVGRVEFLRQQGLPMSDVDQKVHLPVVEAGVRYVRPARLDDLLEVRCWVSERKRASFRFTYEILNEASETVVGDLLLPLALRDPLGIGVAAARLGANAVAAALFSPGGSHCYPDDGPRSRRWHPLGDDRRRLISPCTRRRRRHRLRTATG